MINLKLISLLLFLIFSVNLFGQKIIKTTAPVSDFIIEGNELICCTTVGSIEYYTFPSGKMTKSIKFPKSKDFVGDIIDTEVFKLDKYKNTVFALVRGKHGFSDIYTVINSNKKLLIDGGSINSVIVDIAISSDNMLLLALLSNELIKYDFVNMKQIYRKQIGTYAFSTFSLTADKKTMFSSDESGIVYQTNILNGEVVKQYKGQNVDIVLSIDNAKGKIVCGGKDRRVAVYNQFTNRAYRINYDSFVTTIGINPSGKTIAWYNDLTNDIEIVNLSTKTTLKSLKGHTSMVNKILFISDNTMVSGGIDNQIIIWDL